MSLGSHPIQIAIGHLLFCSDLNSYVLEGPSKRLEAAEAVFGASLASHLGSLWPVRQGCRSTKFVSFHASGGVGAFGAFGWFPKAFLGATFGCTKVVFKVRWLFGVAFLEFFERARAVAALSTSHTHLTHIASQPNVSATSWVSRMCSSVIP